MSFPATYDRNSAQTIGGLVYLTNGAHTIQEVYGIKTGLRYSEARDVGLKKMYTLIGRHILESATMAFEKVKFDILQYMIPIIPIDTGLMRASFMKNLTYHIELTGDKSLVNGTISLDLEAWLTEVPYVRHYIQELSSKIDVIQSPIDLEIISGIMNQVREEVLKSMVSRGFDLTVEVSIDELSLENLVRKIKKSKERTGGGVRG